MFPRTEKMLNYLDKATWFTKVGNSTHKHPLTAKGWKDALTYVIEGYWEELHYSVSSDMFEAAKIVDAHKGKSARDWNKIAAEIRTIVIPMVDRKAIPVAKEQGLPDQFLDQVKWDILHITMATDFSDVFIPNFYADLAYWYLEGHFPCGWDGQYPQGRLIIY